MDTSTAPSGPAASTTPRSVRHNFSTYIYSFAAIFLSIFAFHNLLTVDYKGETTQYLKSVGKADSIDTIIPKSAEDLLLEEKQREENIDTMIKNVIELQIEFEQLEFETNSIQESASKQLEKNVTSLLTFAPTFSPSASPTIYEEKMLESPSPTLTPTYQGNSSLSDADDELNEKSKSPTTEPSFEHTGSTKIKLKRSAIDQYRLIIAFLVFANGIGCVVGIFWACRRFRRMTATQQAAQVPGPRYEMVATAEN